MKETSNNLVVISGCSGGGKSTLLAELAKRGYTTIEEPGRRIVSAELSSGGTALPWINMEAFAHLAVAMALADRTQAPGNGWVFFDRGLIDAASALHHVSGDGLLHTLKLQHRYNPVVFMTPPWVEIYVTDGERKHDFGTAEAEYKRLLSDYRALGYETIILEKTTTSERADRVLSVLEDRH
ncbi:putative ATPase [Rhizobium skierniewicense]|uniref:Putative ATPase n=1 Tax=Rhizobium skierniewicense TaxID=984260 RepID=A0A7W6G2Z1_9HYPH|nr:AAA family ATPase [Rhizobium skierniewicense]MBB3945966.1 putative ATPase [Rhizobium skierniewicense]NTF32731.1 AAA family ATPase [Rhizobium skierniewicense]